MKTLKSGPVLIKLKDKITGFSCVNCGKEFSGDDFRYTCDRCANNLDLIFDYSKIGKVWSRDQLAENKDSSVWRYLPLLPVSSAPENLSLRVGGTPLVDIPRLAGKYSVRQLLVKDDTRNPSGSLKDRATEIGVRHAIELGKEVIIAASTGNAAASLAAISAFYGRKAVIIASSSAPPAKLIQILQYGAKLCLVDGNYDAAFDLSTKISEEYGWYSRSTGINPLLSEGKKTAALEIAEQLDWELPDLIFVPTGDGCIIGGMYKGFFDLRELGWIDRIPRLVSVQSDGSSAVNNAILTGEEITSVRSATVADSISVDYPRDGIKAVRAVKKSGGFGVNVSDQQILHAQHELSSQAGIFPEPAAAASFAGFIKARQKQLVHNDESVLLLISGTGLKDIDAARKMIALPPPIDPDFESFSKYWHNLNSSSGR